MQQDSTSSPAHTNVTTTSTVVVGANNEGNPSSQHVLEEMEMESIQPASFLQPNRAAFHVFKGTVGAGIFLLPLLLQNAGYLTGPIFQVCFGYVVIDATLMLIKTKTRLDQWQGGDHHHLKTYPDVAEFVFGPGMKTFVNWSLVLVQFGWCLLYIQTSSEIMMEVFVFKGSNTGEGAAEQFAHHRDKYFMFIVLATLFVTPLTFFSNNLQLLALASMTAAALIALLLTTTFFVFLREIDENKSIASTASAFGTYGETVDPETGEFSSAGNNFFQIILGWILFIPGYFSVLAGIPVILPVQNAMDPKTRDAKYPKVYISTLIFIVFLYVTYSVAGHCAFGAAITASAVSILPHNFWGSLLRFALAIQLLLTYPLQFVPAIELIDERLGVPSSSVHKKKKGGAKNRGGPQNEGEGSEVKTEKEENRKRREDHPTENSLVEATTQQNDNSPQATTRQASSSHEEPNPPQAGEEEMSRNLRIEEEEIPAASREESLRETKGQDDKEEGDSDDENIIVPLYKNKMAIRNRVIVILIISFIAGVMGSDTMGLVMSFVGASLVVCINIMIPALIHLHLDVAMQNPLASRRSAEYYRTLLPSWALRWCCHHELAGREGEREGDRGIALQSMEESQGPSPHHHLAPPLQTVVLPKGERVKCWVYFWLGAFITVVGTITCVIDAAEG